VDISDYLETKRAMMRQHASQLEWLGEYNGIDIDEFIVTVARFRGLQCGAKYAEGFRRFQGWPRVTPERILP
jgi:LmbE family N-acetylglucosaminyl deacetylase